MLKEHGLASGVGTWSQQVARQTLHSHQVKRSALPCDAAAIALVIAIVTALEIAKATVIVTVVVIVMLIVVVVV